MFHPRCQKAHDFNMTSVSGELRPRKYHHIRHPKEGSLISCLISSVRYVRVCVCVCVVSVRRPQGVYKVTSQLVSLGLPHCLVLLLLLSAEQ